MAKSIFLSFDIKSERMTARQFLQELAQQSFDLSVVGASKPMQVAETQRLSLLTEAIRKADEMVVLVGPMSGASTSQAEEIACARQAQVPVIGVYVNGAAPGSNLPTGLAVNRMYGWDWGTLKRRLA